MEPHRTIGIAPRTECAKEVVGCQCELGREKLLTAPPNRSPVALLVPEDAQQRYQTAPCYRDIEQYQCPTKQIHVIFKSPARPNEVFSKVFPATTPIKYVNRKLSKLLSVSNSNLLLTKNRTVLKETSLLNELHADSGGNLRIDVYTKDAEEFSLCSIPMEAYVVELIQASVPKKKTLPFIAIKFKVRNQNTTFTRSYHSIMKINEIKKNLGGLFGVEPDNIVLLREDRPLKDRMALLDLDYDKYGISEVELLTKNHEKLNFDKLYRENPVNDVISVMVPFGDTVKHVNVEIFSDAMKKPYMGGYRNIHTGN